MMGYARGTIVGNVGRDPELRYLPSGSAICNFSVAVNRKRRDEETVNWYRVVLFGVTAENADKFVRKGEPILVDGEIALVYYQRQDGTEGHQLEIVGGTFVLLGGPPPADEDDRNNAYIPEEELEDVPF